VDRHCHVSSARYRLTISTSEPPNIGSRATQGVLTKLIRTLTPVAILIETWSRLKPIMITLVSAFFQPRQTKPTRNRDAG